MHKMLAVGLLALTTLSAETRTPVLVELFTSEGCSSCPPADDLLAKLASSQPVEGADIIVLSEHVDYWNQLGWKDPYSASLFSERQRRYAAALRSDDVYTPEAVVDGHTGLVGSNAKQMLSAIREAARDAKTPLQLSAQRRGNEVSVDVSGQGDADVWIALVEAKTTSHVQRGENGGRTLQHVGVVRTLQRVKAGSGALSIDPHWATDGLRVVAFAQDKKTMKVVGAAQASI